MGTIILSWQEWREGYTAQGGYTVTKFKEFQWAKGTTNLPPGVELQIGAGSLTFGNHVVTNGDFFAWVEGRATKPGWIDHDAKDDPAKALMVIEEPTWVKFTAAAGEATSMAANYLEPLTTTGGIMVGQVRVNETFSAPYTVTNPNP